MTRTENLLGDLIRCRSVTPADDGALDVIETHLSALGFICQRLPFGAGSSRIDNLFATIGSTGRHFCFAGHSDVVPAGDFSSWRHPPFDGEIEDGYLYGRGAVDMKGAIAAFITAAGDFLSQMPPDFGRLSLLITGDEEGDAVYGTKAVLDWLAKRDLMADSFLVGEPTNPSHMGEMIKNGRRGSLSCELIVRGCQGHAAYPHLSVNPLPVLLSMLSPLSPVQIDDGYVDNCGDFDPSTAAITSIDTGNPARNVTPGSAVARFNIRYSPKHTAASLKSWLTEHFDSVAGDATYTADWHESAAPFVTDVGDYTALVQDAVFSVTGERPRFSTSGGTSDARFIAPYAEVVEFGLVGQTMHQVDECVSLGDIKTLHDVYFAILQGYYK